MDQPTCLVEVAWSNPLVMSCGSIYLVELRFYDIEGRVWVHDETWHGIEGPGSWYFESQFFIDELV
jgi:hypothetical protein